MRCFAVAVTLLLLVASCRRDIIYVKRVDTSSANEAVLPGGAESVSAEDGTFLYTIDVTLPPEVDIEKNWKHPVLLDTHGGKAQYISGRYTSSTQNGNTLSVTFQLADQQEPKVLVVGDYEIDYRKGRVRLRSQDPKPLARR